MRLSNSRSPKARRAIAAAVVGLLCGTGAALGAPSIPCPAPTETLRVAAVVDDLDLALEDGRTLNLAGLDAARGTTDRPALGEAARQRLSSLVVGQDVAVAFLSGSPDRWDRYPVVAAMIPSSPGSSSASAEPLSLNEVLLAEGWARARPDPALRACLDRWLTFEATARARGLGLWADPYYSIVAANDRNGLAERTGAMALVEGRLRLRESQGRLSFALGGVSGLVANVTRSGVKSLRRAGLDPRGLVGSKLRVRGFLDDRFGPRIDIADPGQIEILDAQGQGNAGAGVALPQATPPRQDMSSDAWTVDGH